MGKFWIEDVTDCAGNRYWVLFTHGMFHEPAAVIDDQSMRNMAEKVLGVYLDAIEGDFADAIKRYRELNDLTQQEMATRAGLSRGSLARIEQGESNYTMETWRKLMEAMVRGKGDV